jgi:hypothetical protein
MRKFNAVGCILPSVGRILPSIKLVEEAQTLDATRIEDVRKGIERPGKREIRAFCNEECAREAQDRPHKARAVGAERQGKERSAETQKLTAALPSPRPWRRCLLCDRRSPWFRWLWP